MRQLLRIVARHQKAHHSRPKVRFRPRKHQEPETVDVTDGEVIPPDVDITEVVKEARVKFQPGDRVKVRPSHGSEKFRGDTGVIEKYVPFGKYYVNLRRNGRSLVSEGDLEVF